MGLEEEIRRQADAERARRTRDETQDSELMDRCREYAELMGTWRIPVTGPYFSLEQEFEVTKKKGLFPQRGLSTYRYTYLGLYWQVIYDSDAGVYGVDTNGRPVNLQPANSPARDGGDYYAKHRVIDDSRTKSYRPQGVPIMVPSWSMTNSPSSAVFIYHLSTEKLAEAARRLRPDA